MMQSPIWLVFSSLLLLVHCPSPVLAQDSDSSRSKGGAARPEIIAELIAEMSKTWPRNRTVRFVFHGHSVPAGYFKTPEVRRFDSYPSLFHQAMCERFPTAVIDVNVTAIGGETSGSGAERFEKDVLSLQPDLVVIDYALNDRRLGLEKAEDAWRSMIEACTARGVGVVLLTPTPDSREDILDLNTPLARHAQQIRDLGAEFDVPVADPYRKFQSLVREGNPVESYLSQSNHPNRAGHGVVTNLLLQCFPVGAEDE